MTKHNKGKLEKVMQMVDLKVEPKDGSFVLTVRQNKPFACSCGVAVILESIAAQLHDTGAGNRHESYLLKDQALKKKKEKELLN